MMSPAASRRSLRKRFSNSEVSPPNAGLRYRAPPVDPCLYFVHRSDGGAVGASTTHIDGIAGCGGQGAPSKTKVFSEARSGRLKLLPASVVHVGPEVPQENDYSVLLTQASFASKLQPPETPPWITDISSSTVTPVSLRTRGIALARDRVASRYLCALGQA